MTTPSPVFTPEQIREIDHLIEEKMRDFAGDVKSILETAFNDNRTALIQKLSAKVTEAVRANQGVVLATVQGAKNQSSREHIGEWLKLLLPALLPVLAAIFLGYLVWDWQKNAEAKIWQSQKDIETKIDRNQKFLETQLARQQEYFKRKMDVFQDIYKQLATIYSNARTANANQSRKSDAINSVIKFSGLLEGNKPYITEEAQMAFANFWQAALSFSSRQVKISEFEQKRRAAEDQVSKELDISDLRQIPHPDPSPRQ